MKYINLPSFRVLSKTFTVRKFCLVIFVFLLSNQCLYSQCNLEITKDDFSSSITKCTREEKIINVFPLLGHKEPWTLYFTICKQDSLLKLAIKHEAEYNTSELQSIFFKFKDDSLIKKNGTIHTSIVNTGGYFETYSIFLLTKEDLTKFATTELDKIRVTFYVNLDFPVVDKELSSKTAKKIMKNAACLLLEVK